MRFVGRRDISKGNGELQWASRGVIQIKGGYVFQTYKQLQKEIKAGSYFGLRPVALFPGFLAWKLNRMLGVSRE